MTAVLTIRTFAKSTPFTAETIIDGLDAEGRRLIVGDAPEAEPDPTEITLVDGEIDGTEEDLADVVETIVIEQVAQFMAGRR